jgi:hypothetical protein
MEAVMGSPFRDSIVCVDIETGKVEGEFARLPTGLASHCSWLMDDRYLVVYGGTNGLRFFENVIRYDIETKSWTMMTKLPPSQESSTVLKQGRFAAVSACTPAGDD